jgi:hypothetical protein
VENDLNTLHQQFMYDFIYDQQDIYDYYDEAFQSKSESISGSVSVRQPELPLASALENIDDLLFQFSSDNDCQELANFRWYTFKYSLDKHNSNFNDK